MKLNYILCLLLTILPLACSDEEIDGDKEIDGDNTGQVTLTITPSDEIIVDGKGGSVSFTVTPSNPKVALRYTPNVEWVKAAGDAGENRWNVAENTSILSREGYIYIQDNASLVQLGKVTIIQKSVNGEIQEKPAVSFSEQDVPILIPFAGNSYMTTPPASSEIDLYTGKFKGAWTDNTIVSSTYFRVGKTGDMNLAVVGRNETGNSIVRFTVQDKTYDVILNGSTSGIYGIATIPIEKPGYVRVDMQGISKDGNSFGDVTGFRIGGQATKGENHFVTEEKMAEDNMNCYWFRRGASVHWNYAMPDEDVEYFYNEVLVTEENARNSSYYMMNGFGEGYMGIQQSSSGEHTILFSVWSPYSTDNPAEIPEDKRVKLLRKGKDVTVGEFGNEGSGGQSWLHCGWNSGTVHKALVQVKPDEKGNTIYTAYFYADNEWRLIASFLRPETNTWYKSAHSFLENFDPANSIYTRSVLYKNQWVRLVSGEWKEITKATFTYDETGRQGMRYDCSGSVDKDNCGFVLKSFGFSDEHTNYGKVFTRPSSGTAPDIDIEALENIPSVE